MSRSRKEGEKRIEDLMKTIGSRTQSRAVTDRNYLLALAICDESPVVDAGEPQSMREKREAREQFKRETLERCNQEEQERERRAKEEQEEREKREGSRSRKRSRRRRRR